ncbi:hypothetical protein B9Z35_01050 [Limnohabitans sp. Jir61]|uniref:hypothetical protein n=1 Tax=Limnohabitans sp. Jir61 TaxID=1826168 RepID=UPI000D36AE62|nr:hypothetical protein [Limnohabitans sp. Jir61]PUE32173.1 hypothetical protein B9Z35_01050 [Limnohabitans sp. Jir61]
MNRKDWLIALLAAVIGILATLCGSLVAGYQHERAVARQAEVDFAKQLAVERATELKALKDTGLRYMTAADAMVNHLVFNTAREKSVVEYLAMVQSAGNEVVLIADDELTRQTMALTQSLTQLPTPSTKPMAQRLAELNAMVVDWIKLFKHSLNALKAQNEEALGLRASAQVATPLKR